MPNTASGAWLLSLLLLLNASDSAVLADVLHRKTGGMIEGDVVHDADSDSYVVTTPSGVQIRVPAAEVSRVESTPAVSQSFRERLARAAGDDLDALVEVAVWAREKKYRDGLKRVAQRILEIDSNHEMAREALGFVVFENAWILESDLRKKRQERGLVKFRGEWMPQAERDRRVAVEERKAIEDLFASLATRNRYVQEFAVRKLMAYRAPHARDTFESHLDDEREIVRVVAISALTNVPPGDGDEAAARRIAGKLFRRLLGADPGAAELEALYVALRLFAPRESFRLAIEELQGAPESSVRSRRAGEVVFKTLRKAWVADLCRALEHEVAGRRSPVPAVRRELARALAVDHGFDVAAWLRWWEANAARFRDED